MTARRSATIFVVLALALAAAPVAGAAASATAGQPRTRLYLLAGAGAGQNVWSLTAADPEASATAQSARCEVSPSGVSTFPCRSVWASSKTVYQALGFSAGSLLDAPVTWGAGEVTFRIAMAIESPAEPEVAVIVEGDNTVNAATQVTPGVWTGTITNAGSLHSRDNTSIYVGVRSSSGFLSMSIKTAGASWLEFPQPISGQSGPEVVAASPRAPAPSIFSSAERTYRFNNAAWEVRPFTGSHDTTQRIALPLEGHAAAVHVYIEGFSEPALYAVAHGDGDGRSLEQPGVRIYGAGDHLLSTGGRAAALTDVAAGDYEVEVRIPTTWAQTTGSPPVGRAYDGYVVIVYGARTLAGLRFGFPSSAVAAFNTPAARNFPPRSEHVPVPEAATSLVPVLTAKRVTVVGDRWAMSYGGSTASGSAWTGQRLFVHDDDVFLFGVTALSEAQVSAQDVKFWLDISYTYAPAPA